MTTDEYEDFDVNAVAAEIGAEIFGGEAESNLNSPETLTPPPDAGTAEVETPGLNTSPPDSGEPKPVAPEPEIPLPKSWKKEMEADWKALPETVRKYVQKREDDVFQGIKQYHSGHQSYEAITTPFREIFSQHPDVQPVQLFQNLMHSHVKLLTLPPEEKAAFGRQLLEAYGISPGGEAAQGSQTPIYPPGYQQLQAEHAEMRRMLRENQAAAHAAEVKRYEQEISDFASKNPLFPEVENDILRLISTGAAVDIKSAYETAVWANPSTRVKLLAQQQAEAAAKSPKPKTPMTNIESSGSAKPSRKPTSIDATVDSVIAKHYATH